MSGRDNYLDTIRGIAAISIIIIHTAFWSGATYGVPDWMQTLTLAIDVGLFFFLAGWSISFKEKSPWNIFQSIIEIMKKWIFFIVFVAIISFKTTDLKSLLSSFCFNVSIPQFPVIAGSIWFLPVYICVTFINSIIIYIINTHSVTLESKIKNYCRYLIILLFLLLFDAQGTVLFPQIDSQWLFYSVPYLFGLIYGKTRFHFNVRQFVIGILLIAFAMKLNSSLLNLSINPMQNNKFPPNLTYLFYTYIGILCTIYFSNFFSGMKHNIFSHIGKKALWFYFSQGIGSSILFPLSVHININLWYLKFPVMAAINITITFICAEFLSSAYILIFHYLSIFYNFYTIKLYFI